ncbi:unnamed protein product [Linum tenue]|uniref:Uncharacterized protein n=1 Tax=Linum tenue TaxID=586396 RepID=A0AAV0Q879_9ROSI|nr:unnamed protein product [Linum tenue]
MLTGHYIRLTEAILQGQPHFSFLELQVHPRKMQQTESTQFKDIYFFTGLEITPVTFEGLISLILYASPGVSAVAQEFIEFFDVLGDAL